MYFNYFKAHAAYMNILRKIWVLRASLVKPWSVMSRQLNQSAYGIADGGGCLKQASNRSWYTKTTRDVVFSTRRVQWTVRHSAGKVTVNQ